MMTANQQQGSSHMEDVVEVRKSITLPADLDDWISEQAKREDRSFAAQLRIIVRRAKENREWSDAIGANREAQEA
jgi:hypothetical protein